MIACSRMYNVVPQARAAWASIFRRVSESSGVPLEVIEHPAPAPLEDLWAREDMGCVFMCGWPYAVAPERPQLLAAPVPSPPRYEGKPIYFTDLIVRADRGFEILEDTFGGRLAWTIETSHSGFNALRHHLLRYRRPDRPTLYAEVVGPTVSPIGALRSVIDGEADVAPMDSLSLDLLRAHAPERVAAIRVVDVTEPASMPPLVASAGVDPACCETLTDALTVAHEDARLRSAFHAALIDRFVRVSPEIYETTIARAHQAIDAGYPMPS